MQYMDAEKTKQSIGYLDPTRICQAQHTVTLSPKSNQLKGKTHEEIVLHKQKLITVAQYIGRAFLHFQNKRVILAAYNFNDYYICFIIYPKHGSETVLDPLDYNHRTVYNYYKKNGGEQIQTREKLLIHTYWPLPRIEHRTSFNDTGITNVQKPWSSVGITHLPRIEHRTSFDDTGITNVQHDLCHFIHCECCHVKRRFFDPESILATSEKYKHLWEWNNVMP
uniref:Uncharacterized protein n=1 Tax=Oryza barthii TaxID=65489 RepID=A0A0D3F6M4_9ORYZ